VDFSVYNNPCNNCCAMSFSFLAYTKIDVDCGFAPLITLKSLQRSSKSAERRDIDERDERKWGQGWRKGGGIAPWLLEKR